MNFLYPCTRLTNITRCAPLLETMSFHFITHLMKLFVNKNVCSALCPHARNKWIARRLNVTVCCYAVLCLCCIAVLNQLRDTFAGAFACVTSDQRTLDSRLLHLGGQFYVLAACIVSCIAFRSLPQTGNAKITKRTKHTPPLHTQLHIVHIYIHSHNITQHICLSLFRQCACGAHFVWLKLWVCTTMISRKYNRFVFGAYIHTETRNTMSAFRCRLDTKTQWPQGQPI